MVNPSEDEQSAGDERLHDLIAEYHGRVDQGEMLDPAGFTADHPELESELSRYFENVATLESLAGPTAGQGEADPNATVISGETHDGGHAETMLENSSSGNVARLSNDAPRTQFGRYRIRKELGRGAMGAVYLAHDEQLDREVALKIPKFETDTNQELLERFYREARAAAALQHPGICPVHDVGELDGQHYITMGFIKGRPLRDFTKSSKRQAGKQVARVIRKVAMAMAEAHEHNVVHRDLKPANIMINKNNEPVVMDFGLARRSAEGEEQLTHTGTVIGTPAYMSPEQVDGDNEHVGPHSDIYALGVIFYEMLTGQLPFQGNLMSILKQIALTEPKPPIEIHADIDPSLQAICLKMMAKKSQDRPASMSDVARDLTQWLQGRQVVADETEPLETSRVPGQSAGEEVSATTPVEAAPPVIVLQEPEATLSRGRKPASKGVPPDKRKLVIAGGLAGAVILLAGIVFFVRLGKVNVQITVDDPSLAIKVDGDEIVIDGSDAPIRLSAGTHELVVKQGNLEFEAKEFKVTKDGKNAIHVVVADEKVHLLLNGATPPRSSSSSAGSTAVAAIANPRPDDSGIGRRSLQPLTATEILTSPDWEWTEPVNLGAPINSAADDGDPFLSSNGLTLFFSSDRQLGSDKDIWMSTRPAIDSLWSDPVNVKELNSQRLDARPRLSPDGRTIVFRSAREGGQGSWDLWVSTRESTSTDWHSPRNLGPNVNTPKEEGGHQFSADGLSLTFMSTRTGRQQTYVTRRASLLSTEWSLAERFDRQGLPSFGVERFANNRFATHRSGINSWPLVQRSRASTDVLWGPPTPIAIPGNEEASSFQESYRNECISNDGRTMLFSPLRVGGVGNWDIWMSRRRHKSSPQVLSDESVAPPLAVAPFDADQARAHQQAWAKYLGEPVETTNSIGMKLVVIPAGEFAMGEDAVPVTLTKSFRLGIHEVTMKQWQTLMGPLSPQAAQSNNFGDDAPISYVNWDSATEFCRKLTARERAAGKLPKGWEYRLPTEAEWEWACRAGTITAFSFGDDIAQLGDYAWFNANSRPKEGTVKRAVGMKKPNPWGLHDIHGNVEELCSDWYAENLSGGTDPLGPRAGSKHVGRGGSYYWEGTLCRSTSRRDILRNTGSAGGFRVALCPSRDSGKKSVGSSATPTMKPAPNPNAPPRAVAPFDANQAKAHQQAWADHLGVPVEYENSIGMKFRLMPPGEFLMGSTQEEIDAAVKTLNPKYKDSEQKKINSEAPQHSVILTQPIYLGVNEVTQEEYERIMGTNPSRFSATGTGKETVIAGLDTADHPVEMVSWNDTAEFCIKLSEHEKFDPLYVRAGEAITPLNGIGYRLPTEAEWEFACRAGTTTQFWIGNKDDDLMQVGWFGRNSGGRTHRVGELKANPFGFADIHGNVREWVQDGWDETWYSQFLKKPAINPNGPIFSNSSRVARGGHWDLPGIHSRSSARGLARSTTRDHGWGFRVSLSVDAVKEEVERQTEVVTSAGRYQWVHGERPLAVAPFDADQAKAHQKTWADHLGLPVEKEIELPGGEKMAFMLIPPGEFMMGKEDMVVRTKVPRPFHFGIHEVTQSQYTEIMKTGFWRHGDWVGKTGNNVAASFVSWLDATEFCLKLTEQERKAGAITENQEYRLPTEAEWEFSCRAGTAADYSFGADASLLGDYAWYEGNVKRGPGADIPKTGLTSHAQETGLKKPNPFGLFDVHGNVAECCSELLRGNTSPEGPDPESLSRGIVRFRGGTWQGVPKESRSSGHIDVAEKHRRGTLGFRVLLTLPDTATVSSVE